MLISALLIVVGFVLLVGGGEALVRGASGVALLARMTPAVVGLTVVAAGTSMPELIVSVQAAAQDVPGISLGNVVGSNIFNIGAVLGIAALVRPLRIEGNSVRLEWPVMVLACLQLHLLSRDGTIDRLEGAFLLLAVIAFMTYAVWIARKNTTIAEEANYENLETASFGRQGSRAWLFNGAAILVGVGLLAGGSSLLVEGATRIATALGVSPTVVGLTVVAMGTSLPELAASVMAGLRGRDDMAVGNVIGSNIFNALGIVGATGLIRPLSVPGEIVQRDNWWMIGFAVLLFPLMKTGMRISRWEGLVLLGGFVTYTGILLISSGALG